jgi:NADPH-dependent 2,4-dienoyl-CoA reductase/sulfur reductase-like enzyme
MVAMAGPANRQGRMVADNIMGRARAYRGTIGTSVLRCFGLTAACTGIGEKGLKAAGRPYHAVHVHPRSHASYYPGSAMMSLKVQSPARR